MKPSDYNAMQIAKGALTPAMLEELARFWRANHGIVEWVKLWQAMHGLEVDGMAGPKTQQSLKSPMSTVVVGSQLAIRALRIARAEMGQGETEGNNAGPAVRKYRKDSTAAAWCAAFLSWCFEQACEELGLEMPFKRSHGAKRLYKNVWKAGSKHDTPQVGDLVCWDRGKLGSWHGHVGIVSRVEGPSFWTIEGNRGSFPSKVAEYRHEVGEARLMGFARI